MPSAVRILIFVFAFNAPSCLLAEGEPWRAEARALMDVFARAMSEAKYSELFESFDSESSNEYRKMMLIHYSLLERRGMKRFPPDSEGTAHTTLSLHRLSNGEFWRTHIAWFRSMEDDVSSKLKGAHGRLGTPKYSLHKAFKDGDKVYMLVEKKFDVAARAPLPFEVLEAKKEDGKWKLAVPRAMTWQLQEDISKEKEKLRAGK
jgi:hypothetical protein